MTEPRRPSPNPLRSAWTLAVFGMFAAWTIGGIVTWRVLHPGADAESIDRETARRIQVWCRGVVGLMRMRVRVDGTPPEGAALLAPNHSSYLDILVLGASTPTFFMPKAEIAAWPVVGPVLRLFRQPAVERKRTRALRSAADEVRRLLDGGVSVAVFLEGTTTAGDRVLPFRPGLIEPALEAGADIQPVGIRYQLRGGRGLLGEDIMFWKNHSITHHFWRACGLDGVDVLVRFGEPALASSFRDRKEAAAALRSRVVGLTGLPPRNDRADDDLVDRGF